MNGSYLWDVVILHTLMLYSPKNKIGYTMQKISKEERLKNIVCRGLEHLRQPLD